MLLTGCPSWGALTLTAPRLISWHRFEELRGADFMRTDTGTAWLGKLHAAMPQGWWRRFGFLGDVRGATQESDPLNPSCCDF